MGQRGSIYRQKKSRFWYIAWRDVNGQRQKMSSESELKGDAEDLLAIKIGDVAVGKPTPKKAGKITLKAALQLHLDDLRANDRKTDEDEIKRCHAPLTDYFGELRQLGSIGLTELRGFVAAQLEKGFARATINRRLAALRRSFRLARDGGDVFVVPRFPMLAENNARKGFLERAAFEAIREKLPDYARPILTFLFWTGWRCRSEVLPLTRDRVDLAAGTVRLDVGTTKNKAGRTFYVGQIPELQKMLTEQLASLDALKARDVISPWIFHYEDGTEINDFRDAWETAREAAGCPNALLHDFRRTAVRNLERAGVPRTAAMAMVGHKTESIYRRYSIQDEQSLKEGAAKYAAWAAGPAAAPTESSKKGTVKQFRRKRA